MAPNIFLLTALGIAETGCNSLLELDPAALKHINALEGKQLLVCCQRPELSILVSFTGTGVALSSAIQDVDDETVDTRITGPAAELAGLLSAHDKAAYLRSSNIDIEGDLELSERLQTLLDIIDIDWEAKLASWIGDVPAHLIGNQLKSFINWSQQSGGLFNRHLEEYIHEEARFAPPAAEVEAFYEEIDQLVIDTDRLAARLARMQNTLVADSATSSTSES